MEVKGSYITAIVMHMHGKRNNGIFKRLFIGLLSFLMVFSLILGPAAVYAEEAKEKTLTDLIQGLEELIEAAKNLEKDNIRLKRENRRLKKIIDQGVAKQVPVLLYHHLYNGDLNNSQFKGNGAVVSVDSFREQMKYLKENNYYTATLEELELFMAKKIDLPKKTVVITFDDGYYSNIEYAYPILKEYDQRAAIFVVGRGVEDATNNPDNPSPLRGLGFEDIKNTSDVLEFHSHTYNLHRYIDNEPALTVVGKEEVVEDLTRIKEQIGTKYLAYPFGGYNETTIEALNEVGYKLAFTVINGYTSPNSGKFEIPRIIIWPSTTIERFEQIVAPR